MDPKWVRHLPRAELWSVRSVRIKAFFRTACWLRAFRRESRRDFERLSLQSGQFSTEAQRVLARATGPISSKIERRFLADARPCQTVGVYVNDHRAPPKGFSRVEYEHRAMILLVVVRFIVLFCFLHFRHSALVGLAFTVTFRRVQRFVHWANAGETATELRVKNAT